jgi:hypothetical protein
MMGDNSKGQLGIGEIDGETRLSAAAPCLVESLKDHTVTAVECG